MKKENTIIVSACLLGIKSTFEANDNKNQKVLDLKDKYTLVPICPEQLGGLSTPRIPQAIVEGSGEDVLKNKTKVVNRKNIDVTNAFLKAAQESLKIAKINNSKIAILKDRSPSCGVKEIYNIKSKSDEHLVKGKGVTTALLESNGIKIYSEMDDFEELM